MYVVSYLLFCWFSKIFSPVWDNTLYKNYSTFVFQAFELHYGVLGKSLENLFGVRLRWRGVTMQLWEERGRHHGSQREGTSEPSQEEKVEPEPALQGADLPTSLEEETAAFTNGVPYSSLLDGTLHFCVEKISIFLDIYFSILKYNMEQDDFISLLAFSYTVE